MLPQHLSSWRCSVEWLSGLPTGLPHLCLQDPMLVDLRIAGMYKLSGKKEKLKRPFVVMQKNTEHVVKEGATSYKVLGVVRWRIKFYSEPDLIIRRSETGEEL
eukprot:evm.model.scf_292.3 EVM.evm.TU.scf_292.3   scf_292:21784-22956(+)